MLIFIFKNLIGTLQQLLELIFFFGFVFAHSSYTNQRKFLNVVFQLFVSLFLFHFAFLATKRKQVIDFVCVELQPKSRLERLLFRLDYWLLVEINIVCCSSCANKPVVLVVVNLQIKLETSRLQTTALGCRYIHLCLGIILSHNI